MRWAFFGGIASLVFAGCTLLIDTSDLSGGRGAAPEGGKTDARVISPPADSGPGGDAADSSHEAGPGPCPPDALLCTDFENGFGKLEPHGDFGSKVEIVSDTVHAGTHAYRATSIPRDGGAINQAELRLLLDKSFAPGDTIYFRAYVYFPARLPPETTISKWRSSGTEDMNLKIDDAGRFKVDSDLAAEGPELSGVTVAPTGKWICVDWRAEFGSPGHQLLNIDGVKEIDAVENNISANGYVEVGLGFVTSDTKVTEVVFFDDVIVSKTPVGCP